MEINKQEKLYPNCDASVWMRSCKKEIVKPILGKSTGEIPKWLNGVLIRNGPGSIDVGNYTFKHIFDSSALLHRFAIKDGKVTYQCRFLQSNVYQRNKKANRIVTTEFGTKSIPDPCHTIFQRISALFKQKNQSDNAMISVYPFGDELYAFAETPTIHRINQKTLNTEEKVDISKHVAIVHHTSHPHVMTDGTVYNLGMEIKKGRPYHCIVSFPPKKSGSDRSMFEMATIIASIPARWRCHPSYMHTFGEEIILGITENYFVIIEQPLSVSIPSLIINKLKNEPMAGSLKWYKKEMTRFSVISKNTGYLAYEFYSAAFFYLHIINQYEFENYLVVDICTYKDPSMLECMYVENMKNMQANPNYANMFRSHPMRYILPLIKLSSTVDVSETENLIQIQNSKAKAYQLDGNIFVEPEILCTLGCETPRIHYERYVGKPYRFYYAISADVDAKNPGTIIKVDICNKTTATWYESNCYPSEPIFVPKPSPNAEDDGIVLSAMVWGGSDTNRVGLIILDGKTFMEIGRVEFETPSPAPKCLHGWFLHEDLRTNI